MPEAFWTFLAAFLGASVSAAATIVTNWINSRDNLKRLEAENREARWRDEMVFRRERQREMLSRRIVPKEAEIAALKEFARVAYKLLGAAEKLAKDDPALNEAKLEFLNLAGPMHLYQGVAPKINSFLSDVDYSYSSGLEAFEALMGEIEVHVQSLTVEVQQVEESFAETRL